MKELKFDIQVLMRELLIHIVVLMAMRDSKFFFFSALKNCVLKWTETYEKIQFKKLQIDTLVPMHSGNHFFSIYVCKYIYNLD